MSEIMRRIAAGEKALVDRAQAEGTKMGEWHKTVEVEETEDESEDESEES